MNDFAVERARRIFQSRQANGQTGRQADQADQGGRRQPRTHAPQRHAGRVQAAPSPVPESAAESGDVIGALHIMHSRLRQLDAWLRTEHQLNLTEMHVLSSIPAATAPRRPVGRGNAAARLAKEVELSPSGLTRLVDRLVERGLVARVEDVWDKRVTRLVLTDHGRVVRDVVVPKVTEMLWESCGGALSGQLSVIVAMAGDRSAGPDRMRDRS
jgi:DNA-binding MarR family transcriptional regulator